MSYSVEGEDTLIEFPEGSSSERKIIYPQIELPEPLTKSQINFYRKGQDYAFSIAVSGNFVGYNKRCLELLKEHLSESDLEIIAVQDVLHLARQSVDEKLEPDYTIINKKNRNKKHQLFTINSGIKGSRARKLENYEFFEDNVREALLITNGIIRPILSNKRIRAHDLTFTLSQI